MAKVTIALAGNPNAGKSCIFNYITGARQHVGNYPGVTVEKKEGLCTCGELQIQVVDLPGTYSLTAYSIDEVVARNYILEEKPDVIVNVADASNLERNLYLTTQLRELGVPMVLALNMSDVARNQGIEIDCQAISKVLGIPVVPTIGHKGEGIRELLDEVVTLASNGHHPASFRVEYGRDLEPELAAIQQVIEKQGNSLANKYPPRWLAVKLLEKDEDLRKQKISPEILRALTKSAKKLKELSGSPPEIMIAEARYGYIAGICQEAVRSSVETRRQMSDRLDAVLLNRGLGLPIFLGLMYLVFQMVFTLGEPPMGWIESAFEWVGGIVSGWWPKTSESALKSLLVDGIIGGVGAVIVFLPNILLLFLAIAILEDSGYMARAAFLMDRIMHKIGLHGKSFIPMLLGFGCTVPAIMATRTLDNRADRLTTIMVAPLMSCGARLPIYALIIPAFFPVGLQGWMLWLIYLIGIALAVVSARILRSTLFRGETVPFVMELPPYHLPTLKSVIIHMWERGSLYLKKAGTIILALSVLLWALTSYPKKEKYDQDYQAMTMQTEENFLAKIRDLNSDLGLAVNSPLLTEAIGAELAKQAEQENYYEHEVGYAQAQERYDHRLQELKEGQGGPLLTTFLEMREKVDQAHQEFDQTVAEAGLEQGSPEYEATEKQRDAKLAEAEKVNPQVYAAVAKFREDLEIPYKERLTKIKQAQEAEDLSYSVAGRIGHTLEPLLTPLGFDWKIGTALIGAFAAKEVFVAQLGIVYSVGKAEEGSEALRDRLQENYSPLQAFSIMLFCLISAPCIATIAVTRRETGSTGWALFQLGGLTLLAYLVTLFVYQGGRLLGLGG
ncbi:ferrous iron transport protein B [Desulfobacca acetoxidans]|uniref:Ferrous iron transport protein B n=1 Tax=Desulfobacca acetoxidans (strain ATCC 700848 / DSM 11109 / ASRB2) TaxID=880072 RepID=F2NEN6_DESAR|nr:ferrous iron transport protein B [Desulfobacca acetoxidans]AEB08226.1 ferrous iron transport protein B [Desulfobacca acetoxidans DSM 11109]